MKPLKQIVAIVFVLVCFFPSLAYQADKKTPTAKNYTPSQVWDQKIEWMKKVKVSGVVGITNEDEIYFVQYSEPIPGFLHMRNGQILYGDLQIYKRYNKSENDVERKFIMIRDGKRKVYTGWDVEYYYLAFNIPNLKGKTWKLGNKVSITSSSVYEDWKSNSAKEPAEVFGQGKVTFANGSEKEGLVAFDYSEERADGEIYWYTYIAENQSANVNVYPPAKISTVEKMVDGKKYHFQRLFFGMAELEQKVQDLENGKVGKYSDLMEASLSLDDNTIRKGRVALQKGKLVSAFFYVNDDKTEVIHFTPKSTPQVDEMFVKSPDGEVTYTFSGDGYLTLEEVLKVFQKSSGKKRASEVNTLVSGTITLRDGTILKGKVAQQVPPNTSFRSDFITVRKPGIFFIGQDNKLKIYSRSAIKTFTQDLSTGTTKFMVVSVPGYGSGNHYGIINYEEVLASMPHSGHVVFSEGKVNGKVKISGNTVWYADKEGEITIKRSTNVKSVQINDPDDPQVYFGGENYFIKLHFPFEAISYYKNPYPVHCNEKASKRAAALKDFAAYTAATYTTASQIAGQTSDEDANKIKKDLYEWSTENDGECLVYYDEYILVINATGEKVITYKENIKDVVTSLMLGCEDLEKIKKTIRQHDKIKDIHEMVKYVNESGCASKDFKNLASAPMSIYKWRLRARRLLDGNMFEGQTSGWYKGWIQTLGGNKVEGVIELRQGKDIEGTVYGKDKSWLNRDDKEIAGVYIRLKEEKKLVTIVSEYYLPNDFVRAVGVEMIDQDLSGQYEEFTEMEAYEPNTESFLEEEVIIFNPNGSVETSDGTIIEGKITLDVPPLLWFAVKATLEDEDGSVIELTSKDKIKSIKIKTDEGEKTYVPFRDVFVELIMQKDKYRYFRNPYPESEVGFVSGLASTLGEAYQDEGMQTTDYDASQINVYRKEWVFQNGETNEDVVVNASNYKRMVESYLALCEFFEGLDKKEKQVYLDDKAPGKTLDVLTQCY